MHWKDLWPTVIYTGRLYHINRSRVSFSLPFLICILHMFCSFRHQLSPCSLPLLIQQFCFRPDILLTPSTVRFECQKSHEKHLVRISTLFLLSKSGYSGLDYVMKYALKTSWFWKAKVEKYNLKDILNRVKSNWLLDVK